MAMFFDFPFSFVFLKVMISSLKIKLYQYMYNVGYCHRISQMSKFVLPKVRNVHHEIRTWDLAPFPGLGLALFPGPSPLAPPSWGGGGGSGDEARLGLDGLFWTTQGQYKLHTDCIFYCSPINCAKS